PSLGGRPTVGHVALDHVIGVRIPASQPFFASTRRVRVVARDDKNGWHLTWGKEFSPNPFSSGPGNTDRLFGSLSSWVRERRVRAVLAALGRDERPSTEIPPAFAKASARQACRMAPSG